MPDLLALVSAAPREELQDLVRDLRDALDAALVRLLEPAPARLVPLDEAAELVALPRRRLRSLARGKCWAVKIGRSLRVDPDGLLKWARCSQRVTKAHDPAPRGGLNVHSASRNARQGQSARLRGMQPSNHEA